MSTYADPNKAYVWLDGDAFRAPAGTELPADPFAAELDSAWKPFGGIEAGFELTSEQSVNKKTVWNYRKSAYKVTREPLTVGVKFRAVDNSEATMVTRAQGGKITKKGSLYIVEPGQGEEFALLIRLADGEAQTAFYYPLATLEGPATRAAIDGQNIDGWEFSVTALKGVQEIIPALPEGMSV